MRHGDETNEKICAPRRKRLSPPAICLVPATVMSGLGSMSEPTTSIGSRYCFAVCSRGRRKSSMPRDLIAPDHCHCPYRTSGNRPGTSHVEPSCLSWLAERAETGPCNKLCAGCIGVAQVYVPRRVFQSNGIRAAIKPRSTALRPASAANYSCDVKDLSDSRHARCTTVRSADRLRICQIITPGRETTAIDANKTLRVRSTPSKAVIVQRRCN